MILIFNKLYVIIKSMRVNMTLDEMLLDIYPKSPTVLLSFSRGKDAWACWCALKDKIDFVPFHYYAGPPGLEFIEESQAYAEKKMGKRIINLPAPMLYNMLSAKSCDAQTPARVLPLQELDRQPFTFEQLQDFAINVAGLDPGTYTALGVRAKDSARRALFFKTHGPLIHSKRKFYPVWDWDKDKLIEELKRHDVKLPVDYELWGRTFDGLYYNFLVKIRERFPRDYQKILDWFLLIDMEIYRYEKRQAAGF